jgi:hypothetical protein
LDRPQWRATEARKWEASSTSEATSHASEGPPWLHSFHSLHCNQQHNRTSYENGCLQAKKPVVRIPSREVLCSSKFVCTASRIIIFYFEFFFVVVHFFWRSTIRFSSPLPKSDMLIHIKALYLETSSDCFSLEIPGNPSISVPGLSALSQKNRRK